MGAWHRVARNLLYKYRRQHPERVLWLLELDEDSFTTGALRPVREYARLWGCSRNLAGKLLAEYQAERATWLAVVDSHRGQIGAREMPESLKKTGTAGPLRGRNYKERPGARCAAPSGGPPNGAGQDGPSLVTGVSATSAAGGKPTPGRAATPKPNPLEVDAIAHQLDFRAALLRRREEREKN